MRLGKSSLALTSFLVEFSIANFTYCLFLPKRQVNAIYWGYLAYPLELISPTRKTHTPKKQIWAVSMLWIWPISIKGRRLSLTQTFSFQLNANQSPIEYRWGVQRFAIAFYNWNVIIWGSDIKNSKRMQLESESVQLNETLAGPTPNNSTERYNPETFWNPANVGSQNRIDNGCTDWQAEHLCRWG